MSGRLLFLHYNYEIGMGCLLLQAIKISRITYKYFNKIISIIEQEQGEDYDSLTIGDATNHLYDDLWIPYFGKGQVGCYSGMPVWGIKYN